MLRQLHISGLGVIDDLDLELDPGLNVLTGETGAGKTMVTVGLMLALGARGSAQLVRPGASAARVQARFDAPDGAGDWAEDGEVILARSISPDGKSGARIGGQLATVSALQELGARLVELHGQHQTLRLLDAGAQTAFLDRFAGDAHLVALAAYRDVFERLAVARRALDELTEAARDRERELDLLAYQVDEIQAVEPSEGETERLQAEDARLSHVERLVELSTESERALASDEGATDKLASTQRGLQAAAELDPAVSDLAARAAALAAEVSELAHDLRSYREALAADPARGEEVRERLAALKGLHRKYGASDSEVLAFLAHASQRLADLSGSDERIQQLADQVSGLQDQVADRAERVTTGRVKASPKLAKALSEELQQLGMPGASVQVALEPLPGAGGGGGPAGGGGVGGGRARAAGGGGRGARGGAAGAGAGAPPPPPRPRWRRLRAAVSSRESCLPAAACSRTWMMFPCSYSTRSMPVSGARQASRWAGAWPDWPTAVRCWW